MSTTNDTDNLLWAAMDRALDCAASVRTTTSPNPWVGAVVLDASGAVVATGATEPPGGRHAEVVALEAAGAAAAGGTIVVTLEPCSHHGRTPPCTDAVIASGVTRAVIGTSDPDPQVDGRGVAMLTAAGIEVITGFRADDVVAQLRAYLHHRRTGRPFVVLKSASTLDGRTSAADGSSRWITGDDARARVHRLRAESDAVLVGAGTVRADDPELTVRTATGTDPLRVVLGRAPAGARIHPCLEWEDDIDSLLNELGRRGCLQLLVEGGATVARSMIDGGHVDVWELHIAPAMAFGNAGAPVIGGPTAPTIDDILRLAVAEVEMIGRDIRIVIDMGLADSDRIGGSD